MTGAGPTWPARKAETKSVKKLLKSFRQEWVVFWTTLSPYPTPRWSTESGLGYTLSLEVREIILKSKIEIMH